jgi:uncharacterized protein YndB with AHSA1/START domain
VSKALAFDIARTFEVPRAVVFGAWTDADHLKKWLRPKGCQMTKCSLDLRVGGRFQHWMRLPDGTELCGKWDFQEIRPPSRMVFIFSVCDDSGDTIRHPWRPHWPLKVLSEVEFSEMSGRTTVTIRWTAQDSTEEERCDFDEARDVLREGWTAAFDQLDEYLK